MKIDRTEKSLVRSVERGEWKPSGAKGERARYERYAKAARLKGCRLTMTLSEKDFDVIQQGALAAGVSCEILAVTVLHKYASGRIEENVDGDARAGRQPMVRRLLNMRQAAEYLGCSFWTVRDYVLQGLIPVVQLPPLRARPGARQREALRRVVIDRADLDKFVETHKRRAVLPD
jgi:hypothetical protein